MLDGADQFIILWKGKGKLVIKYKNGKFIRTVGSAELAFDFFSGLGDFWIDFSRLIVDGFLGDGLVDSGVDFSLLTFSSFGVSSVVFSSSDSLLSMGINFFLALFTGGSLILISAFFGDFLGDFFFDLVAGVSLFALGVLASLLAFGVMASLVGLGVAAFLAAFFSGTGDSSFSDSSSLLELLEELSSIVSFDVIFFFGLLLAGFSSSDLDLLFFLFSLVFLDFLAIGLVLGFGHKQNSSIRSITPSFVPLFSRHKIWQMNFKSFKVFL